MKKLLLLLLSASVGAVPSMFADAINTPLSGNILLSDLTGGLSVKHSKKERTNVASIAKASGYVPNDDAPAVVSDFNVIPDADGKLEVAISFNAPSLTYGGSELTEIRTIELLRNNRVVTYFDGIRPGEPVKFTDKPSDNGYYNYEVSVSNGYGWSETVSKNVFVGLAVPVATTDVKLVENEDGIVTVSWEPVTQDITGAALDSSEVTYKLLRYNSTSSVILAENISDTTWTGRAIEDGEQEIIQIVVYPVSSVGVGNGCASNMAPIGTPLTSYKESFADGFLSYSLGLEILNEGSAAYRPQWFLADDNEFDDAFSCDNDNGFTYMKAYYVNDRCAFFSQKIDLSAVPNPAMSFWTFNIIGSDKAPDENIIELQVRKAGDTEYTTLKTVTLYELGGDVAGWYPVKVNMGEFANQVVQFRMVAEVINYDMVLIDNIELYSLYDHDLKLETEMPHKVTAGESFTATAVVTNDGANESGSANVVLYVDGVEKARTEIGPLSVDATTIVSFPIDVHTLAVEPLVVKIAVEYEEDNYKANNESETVVDVSLSTLKAIDDLKGELDGNTVTLEWTEPVFDVIDGSVTEDFESYDSWSKQIEGWTILDIDGEVVGGIGGVDIPGIPRNPASFFIFDATADESKFQAHSGTKFLGSLFNNDYTKASDDWLISPLLNGDEQTISFWAKSYYPAYGESMEFLYSTTGNSPEDFKMVSREEGISGDWTLYEYVLPKGASHFAIRGISKDCYMLMIDDITYQPEGYGAAPEILGYNVWRDNQKINENVLKQPGYVDYEVEKGLHKYVVTIVYPRGESAASNVVEIQNGQVVGVESVMTGSKVSVVGRTILIDGIDNEAVFVSSINGLCIHSGNGNAAISVEVPGIYLVKVGNEVIKVIVK